MKQIMLQRRQAFLLAAITTLFLLGLTSSLFAQDAAMSKADALFDEGMTNFVTGDNKGAIKAWEKLAKLTPNDAKVFYNLGDVYYEIEKYEKSVEFFRKALQLDPNFENVQKKLDDAVAASEAQQAAQKEKQARTKAKWEAFGKSLDQILTPAQNTAPTNGQNTTTGSGNSSERQSSGSASAETSGSGLSAGTYACFTTISIYAGRGGSGAYTYPIYNSSRQTRGSIRIQPGGTYLLDDGTTLHYSLSNGAIRWLDGTFAEASSSKIQTDDAGNPQILIKFNGDKDVWDCTKQ